MRTLLLGGSAVAAIAAMPAAAQVAGPGGQVRTVVPYIEVAQVLLADLDGPNDVLTYTNLAVGVDASVQTARVEVQVSYRYDHRIDWGSGSNAVADGSTHTGLARGALRLSPTVNIEGGAIAAFARNDIRGAAPGSILGNAANTSQIYSAYVGPTLASHIGDATLNAAYRFGYTKVEAPAIPAILPGQPVLDNFDDSTLHLLTASIGTRAGTYAPFGMTLSGGYVREAQSQLDNRYSGAFGRFDAVMPVTPQFAVTAGVGYENIDISQRAPLVDAATGAPVVDNNGRFVADPASPRLIAYDFDGIFWDAGVVWRPSVRTTLTARVGRRYDSMTYLGSLSWQASERSGFELGVYDSVTSFANGLNQALAGLPTSFAGSTDPFGTGFNGCVFSTSAGANRGACLAPTLGGVTTANFRARGADGVFSAGTGLYTFGLGAGYVNRRYLVPALAIGTPLVNVTDQIWYGQAFAVRTLDARSSLQANAYINYFDSGQATGSDVLAGGINGTYAYQLGRLGATASLGLFAFDQDVVGRDVSAQGLVGMRYSF